MPGDRLGFTSKQYVRMGGGLPGCSELPGSPWTHRIRPELALQAVYGSPGLLPKASITARMCRRQVSFVAKWLQMKVFWRIDARSGGWGRW